MEKALYFVAASWRSFITLVVQIWFTRHMGLDLYGVAVMMLAPIIAIQAYFGGVYAEQFCLNFKELMIKGKGDGKNIIGRFITAEWYFTLTFSLTISTFMYLFPFFTEHRQSIGEALALFCFGLSSVGLQSLTQAHLMQGKLYSLSTLYFLEGFFGIVLLFVVQCVGVSVLAFLLFMAIRSFFLTLCLAVIQRVKIKPILVGKVNMTRELSTLFTRQGAGLMLKLGWTNLDVLLFGLLSSPVLAGQYRIIKSLASFPSLVFAPYWNSQRAEIVSLMSSYKYRALLSLVRRRSISPFLTSVLTSIFLFFNLGLIQEIYGIRFDPTLSGAFQIYFFGYVLANCVTPWGRYLQALIDDFSLSFWMNFAITLSMLAVCFDGLRNIISIPSVIGICLIASVFFHYFYFLREDILQAANEGGNL